MTLEITVRLALWPNDPTGIVGFDEINYGGLPQGSTGLAIGGPGSDKTLFALQKREILVLAGLRDNGLGAQP